MPDLSEYSEICTDAFCFLLLYSLDEDESVSGLHQEHVRLSGSTGTKMAQSNLRIEIEQPQVFFYFQKDKKCLHPCLLSSVIFFTCFPTFLIDEDTE